MTPPELRLWSELRRRPDGLKFRRQHPIGPFVLDFYCDAAGLAVEVDGLSHEVEGHPERDACRDAWLARRGVTVLRIAAEDIRLNVEGAVAWILRHAAAAAPSTACGGSPPPVGEETNT